MISACCSFNILVIRWALTWIHRTVRIPCLPVVDPNRIVTDLYFKVVDPKLQVVDLNAEVGSWDPAGSPQFNPCLVIAFYTICSIARSSPRWLTGHPQQTINNSARFLIGQSKVTCPRTHCLSHRTRFMTACLLTYAAKTEKGLIFCNKWKFLKNVRVCIYT